MAFPSLEIRTVGAHLMDCLMLVNWSLLKWTILSLKSKVVQHTTTDHRDPMFFSVTRDTSNEKHPFSRLFPAGLALGNAERKVTFCQTSKRGTTSKWQARHIRCPSERHRTAMSHQPWLHLLKDSRTDCNRQNGRPMLKAERWRSTLGSLPLMIGNLENWTAKSGKTSIDFVERVLHQCIPQSPLPMIVFGGVNAFDPNQSRSQLKSDKQLRKTYLFDGGVGLFNAKEPTENPFAAVKMKTSCKFSWGVTDKCSNEDLFWWLIRLGCCIN